MPDLGTQKYRMSDVTTLWAINVYIINTYYSSPVKILLESCMILTSTVFDWWMDRQTDGRTGDSI